MNKDLLALFNRELDKFEDALKEKNHEKCFSFLGRAHVLSQHSVLLHLKVHWLMFQYSLKRRDFKEIYGQILRLIVTAPGHLLGRVPVGNIGWSTVKLTQTMPVPDDLKWPP